MLKDLPLPVQIILALCIVVYIFYRRRLKHKETKWKYQYKSFKEKEKQETKRVKILSQALVPIAQSDDSVKKVKALFFRNKIESFDSFGKKRKDLIDGYENVIFETMSNEVDNISHRKKAPVRKPKSDKRIKSSNKKEGVN